MLHCKWATVRGWPRRLRLARTRLGSLFFHTLSYRCTIQPYTPQPANTNKQRCQPPWIRIVTCVV